MFLGTYTPRLDDKGRMILPAKYRGKLADGLVMTKGQDRCVYVYTQEEWERFTENLHDAPTTHKGSRDYIRVLLSGAYDEVPDRQGRVTVPPKLREYAHLDRDCTVIGAANRLELWNTPDWEAYLEGAEDTYANQAEEVLPGRL